MIIGGREFDTASNCYIMGILNVTPDSFSDGGKWNSVDAALRHAEQMALEGVDIIDVGGESTRPGYTGVTEQEEIDRSAPVLEALSERFDIPLSIDTYKSAVAEAALRAGAVFVNDIWGLKHDSRMAGLIAKSRAVCCLMHNRERVDYTDFLSELHSDLSASVDIAEQAGIPSEKIILDPGVGFAKTPEMNLESINRLDTIRSLGYPVMLGVSRKSVIGAILGLPTEERLEGSLAAAVIGVVRGCSFLRVHDVKATKRAVTVARHIIGSN